MGKLNSSSIWGQFSYHLRGIVWEIVTGNDVTGSREPETGNERDIISRVFFPVFPGFFYSVFPAFFPELF